MTTILAQSMGGARLIWQFGLILVAYIEPLNMYRAEGHAVQLNLRVNTP